MAAKTIIEINGRKYDARTGEMVQDSVVSSSAQTSQTHPTPQRKGVIDGIQKPKPHTTTVPKAHSKTQKSKTLVRSVVKKPKPHTATVAAKPAASSSVFDVRRQSRSLSRAPEQRLERAEATHQHKSIGHFSATAPTASPVLTSELSVAKETEAQKAPVAPPAAPPIHRHPTSKQQFTHPLATANSHLAKPVKKQKMHHKLASRLKVSTRTLSLAASVMAIVVLAGFFAYQRVPNVSMRVAAARAGFSGTMPSATPAGYSFKGPIEYAKDTIAVTYTSNSDDRLFKIVQRPSGWSSDALLSNYVKRSNFEYQTYQNGGLTVYIMENNNAAWVNRGIWYTLSSSAALSTDQILSMASSM